MRKLALGVVAVSCASYAFAEDSYLERCRAMARSLASNRECKSVSMQSPLKGTDVLLQTCKYTYKGIRLELTMRNEVLEAQFKVHEMPAIPRGKSNSQLSVSFTPGDPCFADVLELESRNGIAGLATLASIDSRTGQVYAYQDRPACTKK